MLIGVLIIILLLSYSLIPSNYFKLKYKLLRKKKGKVLYLTFDDGPSDYTDLLLDVLEKNNVNASFFCVASSAAKYPAVIKRMKENGHLIGLHSYDHSNGLIMSPSTTNDDFISSLNEMKNLGQKITYYRPPWGDLNLCTLKNLKKRKMKLVLWHVMAEDWQKDTTPEIIEEKLLKRIQGGDIICLHDGRGKNEAPFKTIKALLKVLPELKKQGYVFETVDKYEE